MIDLFLNASCFTFYILSLNNMNVYLWSSKIATSMLSPVKQIKETPQCIKHYQEEGYYAEAVNDV